MLIKNKIPVIVVSGDSDTIVPYTENGFLIEKAYKVLAKKYHLQILEILMKIILKKSKVIVVFQRQLKKWLNNFVITFVQLTWKL